MVEDQRIQILNEAEPDPDGSYVLYWMQQSQRAAHNPALEYAIEVADSRQEPLIVGFGLMDDYPEATERHYAFMLEGLAETAGALADRNIKFVMNHGHPGDVALELAKEASVVVCDRAYLNHLKQWRRQLSEKLDKRVVQVEGDVVVPVDVVSDKAEYAARTIRPKINRHRADYIGELKEAIPEKSSLPLSVKGELDASDPDACLEAVSCNRSVSASERFTGGTSEARRRLTGFLRSDLDGYAEARNEPVADQTSHMSPYLQYGQISPVEIAFKIKRSSSGSGDDRSSYLEEMIVRRELAHNYAEFNEDYDQYSALPEWARKTLAEHRDDPRPERYTRSQLEGAETHDPYWNAAQCEMVITGFMHNYMRMYWGKKILEWSNTPEYAYRTTLYLNNKYLLDGLNANSYTNVGWIYGLHDRAWTERDIFGKVRYMNANGLRRKFDIEAYVASINELIDNRSC